MTAPRIVVDTSALMAMMNGEPDEGWFASERELALLGAAGVSRFRGSPAHLNYGDSFTYALAKALDCPILCNGDGFVHTDVDVIRPI